VGVNACSWVVDMTSARPERPVGELLGDFARLHLGAWVPGCLGGRRRGGLDEAWTDGILPDLGSRYGAYEFCTSGAAPPDRTSTRPQHRAVFHRLHGMTEGRPGHRSALRGGPGAATHASA
jgi:hypothetical protein